VGRRPASAVESQVESQGASRARSRSIRKVALVTGIAAIALVSTGCTANEAFFFDLPDPATAEAPIIQNLWNGSWIAAWAVGIVAWALMLFAAVAYRRRRNDNTVPEQTKYNLPIEVLYTIVPLIMILGLFWFTARDQTELLTVENDQDQTVNVVGFRWSWAFNYLDEDVYEVGTPGIPPTLVLPVDEKIKFELTSPDVIHSFWVIDWLFKMDIIPGKVNTFEVTPNKLGTFIGRCAELCGVDHARMLFNVRVVTREEFDAHIAELRAKGQTGKLESERVNYTGERPSEGIVL
jgi:cytochrome c oxidase subunit 2